MAVKGPLHPVWGRGYKVRPLIAEALALVHLRGPRA